MYPNIKRRRGGQPGNQNAFKHGFYADLPLFIRHRPPAASFEEAEADFLQWRERILEEARQRPYQARTIAAVISLQSKLIRQRWHRGIRNKPPVLRRNDQNG